MAYFITGTDTDSGKTLVSSALLYLVSQPSTLLQQPKTLGLKPIASGCEMTNKGLRNADALSLISQSTIKLPYERINPISFEPAIAPHIAAKKNGTDISVKTLLKKMHFSALPEHDFCLIEGAGGWRLPLGNQQFMSQVVQALSLPVIMVVGMKLGCLNHALLTQEAILADGLNLSGWVANCVDPNMSNFDDNLQSLTEMMRAPLLGTIPFLQNPTAKEAAKYINFSLVQN